MSGVGDFRVCLVIDNLNTDREFSVKNVAEIIPEGDDYTFVDEEDEIIAIVPRASIRAIIRI